MPHCHICTVVCLSYDTVHINITAVWRHVWHFNHEKSSFRVNILNDHFELHGTDHNGKNNTINYDNSHRPVVPNPRSQGARTTFSALRMRGYQNYICAQVDGRAGASKSHDQIKTDKAVRRSLRESVVSKLC